jgi:hypothetical protein
MTLKEKFIEVMNYQFIFGVHQSDKIERASGNLEKIADEFAIGFAEWRVNDWVYDERWTKISDIKELLEIYKKEKLQ